MSSVQEELHAIRRLIESGNLMAAYERYYADDVVVKSNDDPPMRGKKENIAAHGEFFKMAKTFQCRVKSALAGEDVSMIELEYEVTDLAGNEHRFSAVAVHDWRRGAIVAERFYKNLA